MTVTEKCEMVSLRPPSEWSERVLHPLPREPVGIFGRNHVAMRGDLALSVIEALTWTDLAPSNGQARTAIRAGAVRINGERCVDDRRILTLRDALSNLGAIVIENGRRNFGVIEIC